MLPPPAEALGTRGIQASANRTSCSWQSPNGLKERRIGRGLSIPQGQMYDSARPRLRKRVSFSPALLGQSHLSRSLCRVPAVYQVFALYGEAAALCKHGSPPRRRGGIERKSFRLPDQNGKSPAWHVPAPALYESVEPPVGLVSSLAREALKVATGVAATVLFEGEDFHRGDTSCT